MRRFSTILLLLLAKGATVVQIHGASPLAFNYINPSDDPRNKK